MSRAIRFAACALAASASACVASQRTMQAPVDRLLHDRLGAEAPAAAEVDALLAQPLTRASLTRIVLARHPRVAAAFAALGGAAGEQAALRGLGRTEVELSARVAGDDPALDLAVMHDVLDLALAGPRRAAGEAVVEAARARAGATVLAVTARAELAFLDVAAADAQLAQARTAFDAMAASAELTGRIHGAGGTTDLALARAQAAREAARVEVARAETTLEAARAALDGAAGFTGASTAWSLGEELPALPDAPPALDGLEAEAIGASLELVALAADERGHANSARAAAIGGWLPDLALGVAVERSDHGTGVGPAIRLGLPFLSGSRGAAVSEGARSRSTALLADAVAIELRARARATRVQALAAYAEARQLRDVVVPLQRRVLDETVLQYNAMNASPFELLSARHELAMSEQALVEARHQLARALVAVAALRRGAPLDAPGVDHASP